MRASSLVWSVPKYTSEVMLWRRVPSTLLPLWTELDVTASRLTWRMAGFWPWAASGAANSASCQLTVAKFLQWRLGMTLPHPGPLLATLASTGCPLQSGRSSRTGTSSRR